MNHIPIAQHRIHKKKSVIQPCFVHEVLEVREVREVRQRKNSKARRPSNADKPSKDETHFKRVKPRKYDEPGEIQVETPHEVSKLSDPLKSRNHAHGRKPPIDPNSPLYRAFADCVEIYRKLWREPTPDMIGEANIIIEATKRPGFSLIALVANAHTEVLRSRVKQFMISLGYDEAMIDICIEEVSKCCNRNG